MKPPSDEAVQRALSILIQSILEENQSVDIIPQPLPKQLNDIGVESLTSTSEALALARATIKSTCLSQLAIIHKQINTVRPIRRLPREIFEDILLKAIDMGTWSVASLHRLARVSTYWRDVVLTSPRLWAVADIGSPPTELVLALRKSASAPLLIDAVYRGGFYHNPRFFMSSIVPHVSRCTALAAGNTKNCTIDGIPELSAVFDNDFPELVDLRLESVWASHYIPRRFWGDRLRRVHLQATAVAWASLARLTHLTIDQDGTLLPDQLLKVITASPELEVLHLQRLSVTAIQPPPSSPTVQIDLPALKEILLENSTDSHINAVMSSVTAKSLQKLHIWAYNRLTGMEDVYNTQPTWFNSKVLQRHINAVTKNIGIEVLDVRVDPFDIITIADGPFAQSSLAISVHLRHLGEGWWDLIENIDLPLRLFVPSLNDIGHFQPCMLERMTSLIELEVGDAYAYAVTTYLTNPNKSGMACPHLSKLTLLVDVRWGLATLVVKLLEARKTTCEELSVYDGDGRMFDLASGSFRREGSS